MAWVEPKINWDKEADRFEAEDYNRIKGNLKYLHEKAQSLYKKFQIRDMGSDKQKGLSFFYADEFNAFEINLEKINQMIYTKDYGIAQSFFENGPFIKWDELNRIENACLSMKELLDIQERNLRRLAFRFGSMKGVNV